MWEQFYMSVSCIHNRPSHFCVKVTTATSLCWTCNTSNTTTSLSWAFVSFPHSYCCLYSTYIFIGKSFATLNNDNNNNKNTLFFQSIFSVFLLVCLLRLKSWFVMPLPIPYNSFYTCYQLLFKPNICCFPSQCLQRNYKDKVPNNSQTQTHRFSDIFQHLIVHTGRWFHSCVFSSKAKETLHVSGKHSSFCVSSWWS